MRNVQLLRKKEGLQKLDRIKLFVQVRETQKPKFNKFKKDIEEKVGAEKMEFITLNPVKKHQFHAECKIKEEKFSIWFDKV